MKKTILLIAILYTNTVFSQITFEKTIKDAIPSFSYSAYVQYIDSVGTVKLFNYDHTLISNITITIPTGYKIYNISQASKNVFDTDTGYEILVVLMTKNAPLKTKIFIVNDNGSILKDFGTFDTGAYAYIQNTADGNKLIVAKYFTSKYEYDIYFLPSSGTTEIKGESIESISVYPNPTDGMVKLSGTTGEITVFNINGTKIGIFNSEAIDLRGLPSGMYLLKQGEQTIKVILK